MQIPDTKSGDMRIDAVVVDEDAVGSLDQPGCGAKILCGDGAFDRYLSQIKVRIGNLNQYGLYCLPCASSNIMRGLKILQAVGDGAASEVDGEADISPSRAMGM